MKTAFVTGGSSGIGQAIIKALNRADWKVIAPSRQQLDLSDLSAVSNSATNLVKNEKQIDALIYVAGVWHDVTKVFADKKLESFSGDEITSTMNVGITSFMLLTAKVLTVMPKGGIVVGISGTFADGGSGWLPYFTSKRALEDFLVGLAQDYPKGPKVYGISPADTATPAYMKFYPQYAVEAQAPAQVGQLVRELLGEKSRYKSGDIIEIRDSKSRLGFHS